MPCATHLYTCHIVFPIVLSVPTRYYHTARLGLEEVMFILLGKEDFQSLVRLSIAVQTLPMGIFRSLLVEEMLLQR